MKIIKRNGTEVVFDIEKINKAISKMRPVRPVLSTALWAPAL